MEKSHTLDVLRSLQDLVYSPETSDPSDAAGPSDPQRMYDALCTQAVAAVDGCDHASLMVMGLQGPFTLAASGQTAVDVDRIEIDLGQGPCVEVLGEGEPEEYVTADLATNPRWPGLAAAVLANTPVRGAAGFRLRLGGRKLGALNLLSETPGALTASAVEQGAVFAAMATLALATADSERRAVTMEAGLRSNRVIGTAVGLVMAAHGLDAEAAFQVLSRLSQDMNRKLAHVAADVIANHGSPPPR